MAAVAIPAAIAPAMVPRRRVGFLGNSRNGKQQRHGRWRNSGEFPASLDESTPLVVNFAIFQLLRLRGHWNH
jgi:hypothetical protein